MKPPQRIFTDFPREQLAQTMREIDRSIEVDRAEIGFYQILQQKLSSTHVTAPREPSVPMGVDLTLREKDLMTKVLQGLVQKEYEEINGKQEVMRFLDKLMAYAT